MNKGSMLVYLASPYSDNNNTVMQDRFEKALSAVNYLMAQGFVVFSPICHNHALAMRYGLPRGFEYWRTYDETYLSLSGKLIVLKLDGWRHSIGVKNEMEIATKIPIPVVYLPWEIVEEYEKGLKK